MSHYLNSTLHQEQRSGKERKPDKIWRPVFLSKLKNSNRTERDWSHGRVTPQLRVHVRVPAAHIVPVPVQVHETRIKFVPSHRDESVKKIQKLRGPVEIFVQLEAGVVVVAGAVPRYQTGLVLPFTANFDLKNKNWLITTILYLELHPFMISLGFSGLFYFI